MTTISFHIDLLTYILFECWLAVITGEGWVGIRRNMLISDEMLLELEKASERTRITGVRALVPVVSDQEFNAAFTEVVTDIANKDANVRRLAQQLSDELEGVGIVNALKVLAGCGMLINERARKR